MTTGAAPGVHVQVGLSSRPENVAVVRAMLTGVLEALSQPVESGDAVRTAVSEACNNIVMHAYPGSEGPMFVDVTLQPTALEVMVRDRGSGILPHVEIADDAMRGVGLAVVQAFTDRIELRGAAGAGTTLLMEFALQGDSPGGQDPFGVRAPRFGELDGNMIAADATLLSLAPTPLVGPVLAHVGAALASQARFTVDRLHDTQLVSDALAANAKAAMADGRVVVRMRPAHHALSFEVGPLKSGAADRLVSEPGPGRLRSVLGGLTDEIEVRAAAEGEVLFVRMTDRRPPVAADDARG